MRSLIQLSVSFEVEDEDRPDLSTLIAEAEHAILQIDGVDDVAMDVAASTRKYTLVAEIEGHDPDAGAASLEIAEVVKRFVKVVEEPRIYDAWTLEEMED